VGTIDRGAEGAEVERRRREKRGVGADRGLGVGMGFPPSHWDLKMVSFDAFYVVIKSLDRSVNTSAFACIIY